MKILKTAKSSSSPSWMSRRRLRRHRVIVGRGSSFARIKPKEGYSQTSDLFANDSEPDTATDAKQIDSNTSSPKEEYTNQGKQDAGVESENEEETRASLRNSQSYSVTEDPDPKEENGSERCLEGDKKHCPRCNSKLAHSCKISPVPLYCRWKVVSVNKRLPKKKEAGRPVNRCIECDWDGTSHQKQPTPAVIHHRNKATVEKTIKPILAEVGGESKQGILHTSVGVDQGVDGSIVIPPSETNQCDGKDVNSASKSDSPISEGTSEDVSEQSHSIFRNGAVVVSEEAKLFYESNISSVQPQHAPVVRKQSSLSGRASQIADAEKNIQVCPAAGKKQNITIGHDDDGSIKEGLNKSPGQSQNDDNIRNDEGDSNEPKASICVDPPPTESSGSESEVAGNLPDERCEVVFFLDMDKQLILEQKIIESQIHGEEGAEINLFENADIIKTGSDVLEEIRLGRCGVGLRTPPMEAMMHDDSMHNSEATSLTPRRHNRKSTPGCLYEGSYDKDGLYHGKGEMMWDNGDRYVGRFDHGMRQGMGKFFLADGSVYDGWWRQNLMHGHGTKTSPDGSVYIGNFAFDRRNGRGQYLFANGDSYLGNFKDDEMDGAGLYYFHNLEGQNDTFEGIFRSGQRQGWGKYYWADGQVDVIRYLDDERVGIGVKFSADRKKMWKLEGTKRRERLKLKRAREILCPDQRATL